MYKVNQLNVLDPYGIITLNPIHSADSPYIFAHLRHFGLFQLEYINNSVDDQLQFKYYLLQHI